MRVLASHRIYLGVLLGLAVWAFFWVLSGGYNILSPLVCMLVIMWVAGAYEPGKMAALGVAIGFPAGVFTGVQDAVHASLASSGAVDLWLDWSLQFPLTMLAVMASFTVAGLVCGSVAQLYKRSVIF